MPKGTRLQRAYLAGLFDGEGYIGISMCTGKKGWRLDSIRIVIKMCDKSGIDLAKSIYGGTIKIIKASGPRRQQYNWALTSRFEVELFIQSILPFCRIKRSQLNIGMQFIKTFQGWNKLGSAKGSKGFLGGRVFNLNRVPENVVSLRAKLYQQMKELKYAS